MEPVLTLDLSCILYVSVKRPTSLLTSSSASLPQLVAIEFRKRNEYTDSFAIHSVTKIIESNTADIFDWLLLVRVLMIHHH